MAEVVGQAFQDDAAAVGFEGVDGDVFLETDFLVFPAFAICLQDTTFGG